MKEKIDLITEKAKRDKRLKFTSLIHHINEENLAQCYRELKRDKACGIDNITVEEYGQNLMENIRSLMVRLKTKVIDRNRSRGYISRKLETRKRNAA